MKIETRLKIYIDDVPVMGKGPFSLLKETERCGSLHMAAKTLGMAYSKAWSLVKRVEQAVGFELLERKIGGISGGGSKLTESAVLFLEKYELLSRETGAKMDVLLKSLISSLRGNSDNET